ncbi:hypothetical protein SAMN04488066_11571 [Halorubrum aquaticum]|uniref:Uncharacterized protein n=1 Tax=Halorubrum aquaticum TaxID=387340 RepID=A0A1I3BVB1_9EURY|nr:hypothetical protein [Halorubrum aquaticum]SFH65919.1 hypothetical protein SAMN04488066_11571 [Halorubrum aquaticum]
MSLGADVVEGVISRFSNSGNAMLQTDDGEEWNVGPLPASAEGERIRAKVIDSLWAVCVERPYANKEYLEEMRSRTDLSQQELQLSNTGSTAPVEDVGEVFQVTYSSNTDFSEYDGGKPIYVNLPQVLEGLNFGDQLPARIIFVRRGIAVAVPALDSLSFGEIAAGDIVEVEVEETISDGEGIVGFESRRGLPVVSSDVVGFQGATLKLGVVDVFNSHVAVSPSVLPEGSLPTIGEVLLVDIVRSLSDGTARGLYERIPTVTPDSLGCFGVSDPFKMAVTGYSERGVSVSVEAVPKEKRPDIGDTVECTVITPYKDGTFCRVEDFPVWVSDTVPTPVSSFQLSILGVTPSHLVGSIAQLPTICDLEEGDSLSVEIQFEDENDGIGLYSGAPIVVPDGRELKGKRARFGVEEVRDASVVVGVNALDDVPKVNEVVTLPNEGRQGGRICVVDSLPFVLPPGSDWPSGDVRLGVSEVAPMGIKLSVADLPPEHRPDKGDEIEVCYSDIDPHTAMTLIDGVPVQIPQYEWSFHGPLRLGVSQVRSNCVACSVGGLSSVPAPGERATATIDEATEDGCGGRVNKVPTFFPRMNSLSRDDTEVLLIDVDEDFLVAVEINSIARDLDVENATLVAYYRELLHAKECWEDDEFYEAREYCQAARELVTGDNDIAELLRLDARRHEIILAGEQVRRERGAGEARKIVKEMIESFVESNGPVTESLVDELQAYRLVLDAYRSSDSESRVTISKGYLIAVVRKMTDARNREENRWKSVTPHPVISTLLARIRLPSVPAAGKINEIVSDTPEYWPFLTLSELT